MLGELIMTCARVAGSQVEIVPVPPDAAPPMFPTTPLAVTAADVLAWDRERGEPPLRCGLSPAEEESCSSAQPSECRHR